jgi:hypothetical protein
MSVEVVILAHGQVAKLQHQELRVAAIDIVQRPVQPWHSSINGVEEIPLFRASAIPSSNAARIESTGLEGCMTSL